MKLPRDRFDYSPMRDRRPWTLPKGARIAVWTIVNVEEWDIERAMARQYLTAPQGVATVPDVPNWAWHDYGMRVGFWRLLDALDQAKDPRDDGDQRARGRVLRAGRAAMLDAGWEFMAHGVIQGAMHLFPTSARPSASPSSSCETSRARSPRAGSGPASPRPGRRSITSPRRASSTSPTGSTTTSPTRSRPSAGPLVSVPYTLELNDIPMMVIQHHAISEWLTRCKDQFDRLYAEGAMNPRVMAPAGR